MTRELCHKLFRSWENDLSFPDVTSLPRLAEIFGMSVDELMQVKQDSQKEEAGKSVRDMVSLACKGVCLAMGVAVVTLSVLGELEPQSATVMLGLGLACAGISLLEKK